MYISIHIPFYNPNPKKKDDYDYDYFMYLEHEIKF